ncbi:MAG: ATP-binding protein, partial [Anaerolineae bacterium]
GPRTGRFSDDGLSHEIHGASVPLAALGSFILYIGWMGFNGGSHLAFDSSLPKILLNTILAGASGLSTVILVELSLTGKIDAGHLINGLLAGLVAVTGGVNGFSTAAAILVGSVGSLVMLNADRLLAHWKIDDAVGAVPVHLAAGVWGTFAVGLLGNRALIGTELGRLEFIFVQLLGIVACAVWAFGLSYLLFWFINRAYPLRVPHDEEHIGLNISEHNASSELFHLFRTMDIQSENADVTLRVPEEPFTTVGQIAVKYNRVMDRLELKTEQAVIASHAKNSFLANMSHEMRTPLNAIIGYSESILEVAEEENHIDSETEEEVTRILQSGRHLLVLIDDILDLSKLEVDKVVLTEAPFNLIGCISSTFDLLYYEARSKGIDLTYKVGELPSNYFEGDSIRLRQILLNLISNGLKFTREGSVSLNVDSQPAENGRYLLCFRVKDTGIGIPAERIDAIFKIFSQADESISRSFGGTGLGLAITERLVKLMGGTIWVESKEQVGSTFYFTINLRAIVQ